MKVDILHSFSNTGDALPWRQVLERARQRITLADELGIDGFWLGEHHFDSQGVDQSPNPALLLADLASRTESIRIGIAAIILPAWNPIRLAEDLAALDHMTDGRLDVAFSRGILQAEIINFNPDADRKDDAKSKAIFAENLALVRAAWTQDPLSWKSEHYEFPYPGTKWPAIAPRYLDDEGRVVGLSVIPRPYQPGGPRLFSVTDSTGGVQAAAQQDLGVITWFPTRGVLDNLNADYQTELDGRDDRDPRVSRKIGVLRGYHVAPTDAEARADTEAEVTRKVEMVDKVPSRGRKVWLDVGEDVNDPAIRDKKPFDLLFERDHLLIGSPDTVAAKMIEVARKHDVEHWVLSPYSDENDELVNRSMRLLSQEVLPQVRSALGG